MSFYRENMVRFCDDDLEDKLAFRLPKLVLETEAKSNSELPLRCQRSLEISHPNNMNNKRLNRSFTNNFIEDINLEFLPCFECICNSQDHLHYLEWNQLVCSDWLLTITCIARVLMWRHVAGCVT